jgi:hypothetical protein
MFAVTQSLLLEAAAAATQAGLKPLPQKTQQAILDALEAKKV